MAIVWSDPFTVGADERLNARTGWTRIGGNGSATNNNQVMLVEAAPDSVRMPGSGFYEIARATDGALPTGDQQLNLSVTTGSNSLSHAGGMIRCPTSGGENGYQCRVRPSDGYTLVRAVGGAYTDLATGGSIAVSTTVSIQCRATGTGTVALSIRDSGGTPIVSYNDSAASRHDAGTCGIGGYNEGGTNARIDNVEVDDLSSGAVTLTVQDAALGVTADSPSLTQANTLAVDEATLSVAAEEPVLTQAHVLAVAEALLGLAAEAPTLTQANVLAVQDALLALNADSPALTQASVLAIQDALLALSADSLVIGDAVVLVVQGALLVVTADVLLLAAVDPSYEGWTGLCAPLRGVGSWDVAALYDSDALFDDPELTFDGLGIVSPREWAAACRPAAITDLRFAYDEYGLLYLSDESFLARSSVVPLTSVGGVLALDDTASSGLAVRKESSRISIYD